MQIDSFIQTLGSRLDSVAAPGERLKVIAENVAAYFSLRIHEVGLFAVNHKLHAITFLLPEGMVNSSHIPLNAVKSLVARTAIELAPTLDNAFATSRHLFMFEHMLAEKNDRIKVQKIMSVPIIADGVAKGVIQVSRKGGTPAEAGADFTGQDLADLGAVAAVIAAYDLQLS